MELFYAFLASALFAAGIYSILRRNLVKLIIGMILLSQAANLIIFLAGGLTAGSPPTRRHRSTWTASCSAGRVPLMQTQ